MTALVTAVLVGACVPAPQASDDPIPTTTTTTTTIVTTTSTLATTSTTAAATTTTNTRADSDALFRVAEEGPWVLGLIVLDEIGARKQGHTGEFGSIIDGPLIEVVELPGIGFVFQTELRSSVIYFDAGEGPQELLVATGDQTLNLEGVVIDTDEVPHVVYQRYEGTTPPTARSTLRSYNFETSAVRELVETGGWESGTSFSHVTTNDVVGMWGAEGFFGLSRFDLSDGTRTYNTADDPELTDCFDGDVDCPDYRAAVIWDGRIHGIGPVPNSSGIVDAFGLYEFDQVSGTDTLLLTWPWDNGLWYVEDMFASGIEIVVSLSDGEANPLPALVIDMTTGESWTLPEPGFVRPGYLS